MKKILLPLLMISHSAIGMRHVRSLDFFESEQFSKRTRVAGTKNSLDEKLFLAVINSILDQVELLLAQGVNVNSYDQQGYSLVHHAIMNLTEGEALGVLGKLLDYNPNLDRASDCDNETPLMHAVKNGFVSVVKLLLSKGANPNIENSYSETALHYALPVKKNKRFEMVKLLIDYGAGYDYPDRDGMTPLVYAIADGDTDLATYLLEKKACVSNQYAEQYIPQLIAARGPVYLLDLLAPLFGLEWIDKFDCEWETPLHKAAFFGNKDSMIKLLEYEPNPFYENVHQKIASEVAASRGYEELAATIKKYEYLYIAKNSHKRSQFRSLQ